ncbi:MAG: hypothetical protein EOM87_05855 [Clostridia bacterium]|nr:hypothetical protein [Clostridia bacterium]
MLGLKQNEVALLDHQSEWEEKAAEAINKLKEIFGNTALDIQHIGSTAIHNIKAKPMLDIVLGVENFDMLDDILPKLAKNGVYKSSNQPLPGIILCAIKENRESDIVLCNLHIVVIGSEQWNNHIVFRDYMNAFPQKVAIYEKLKIELAEKFSADRKAYCNGKTEFINTCISEARIYADMKRKFDIKVFKPIDKGLSGDKKYYIETASGDRFMLRLSDIIKSDKKKAEFERMKQMSAYGIPMPEPVKFGVCDGGQSVYQLTAWCDGVNLETVLSGFPEAEQYALGIKAGMILNKIHRVPILESDITEEIWETRYSGFIDDSIKSFHDCGVTVDGAGIIIDYFNNNRCLLKSRPQCYLHGDYHMGNMMLYENEIYIIDWEIHLYNCYGDPWLEITMQETPHFSTGLIDGYFGGNIPDEFWRMLAFYSSISAVSSVPWAYYCFPEELDSRKKLCADVLRWYDNMQNIIPSWYIKNYKAGGI